MALINRTLETMVESVLNNIVNADIGITDIGKGSVIRTIVESLLSELEILYYQSDMIYDSKNIDTTSGGDLDGLVSLFGIVRNTPTKAIGICTFSRSVPAINDILIPIGTIISTHENSSGVVIEFITLDDATILAGTTYINTDIEAVNPGYIYINSNQLVIMNTPIIGVESVTNGNIIDGGVDTETDDELRIRAKSVLSTLGKGTCDAIKNAILELDEITDVKVIDMPRGIGTVDVLITGVLDPPLPQTIIDKVEIIVNDTKSAGVDVIITYPTITYIDVTINLIGSTEQGKIDIAGDAIISYINSLDIGSKFIINQMERVVLNTLDDDVIDIMTILPLSNIDVSPTELLKVGTISVGGIL